MFRVLVKKAFVFVALLVFFIVPFFVLAQNLEINYPEVGGEKPVSLTLPSYVKYIFTFFIGLSGIIALGALIWGGFIYLTSVGDVSKMKEGREKIFSAFLGITILLSSYILLSTINPQLAFFNFPPLPDIPLVETKPAIEIAPDKASLISGELPLEQAIVNGVWKESQIKKTEDLINLLENFLKKPTKINDPELTNDVFESIASLNKHLQNAAAECRCENLTSFCAKPEAGSAPLGCAGDPCQYDQDIDIEPDSPRAKINTVLALNGSKTEILIEFKKQLDIQRDTLRQEIRKYQLLENEMTACYAQKGELTVLNNFLANKQILGESGIQSIVIPNYFQPRQSNLTFYCTAGGTIFDSNYTPPAILNSSEEKIGCPLELNTGGVLDTLKELAIAENFKLDSISTLIEELTKKLENMGELVSHCDDSQCKDSCACFPNPCYGICDPDPLDPCSYIIFACRSRCFQAPGGCHGDTCPREKIEEKIKEIKETEKKMLAEIGKAKAVFPKIPKLKTVLNNLDVSVGLCSSSDYLNPAWEILTCQSAINNGDYDKNGQIISSCHPRNLFCCTLPGNSNPPLPASTDTIPFYISPIRKLAPLPTVNNCPKSWLCDADVQIYNQYKDASEPLKQLLACMRPRLDLIGQANELKTAIGVIGAITDVNIYHKRCGWETGATTPGGCEYAYDVEYGKEKVSAHYGGLGCRYNRQSYAVDISLMGSLQKEYAEKIIDAAKTCSPGAYIVDESPYLHIDVAQINQCSASE